MHSRNQREMNELPQESVFKAFMVWVLLAIPLIAALFYGVAGADKFTLLSPLAVAGYACLSLWLVLEAISRQSVFVAPVAFYLLLAFVAFGAIVGLSAEIPYEAKVRVLVVGLVVGSYLVWSSSFSEFRNSRMVLGVVLLFALMLSFYGLIGHFKSPEMVLWAERYTDHYIKHGEDGTRLASTYICPNHFAHLLQMLLPFCLVLVLIPRAGLFLRILSGYCFVMFWPAMYFTQSRAGMLGSILALGITVLLLSLRKSKKLFLILLVAVPFASSVLVVGAWHSSEMVRTRLLPVVEFLSEVKSEGFANTSTTDFRPLTWLDTVDMIKERPLTGFGPGSYWYAYPEHRVRYKGARVVSGHPHNEFLEVASEYGLVGFGLLAVAWVYGCVRLLVFSLKTSNDHHAFLSMAFLGTVAGTLFHSFFDFQMHVFPNALIFALLAGIAAGPLCRRKRERLMKDANAFGFARRAVLGGLALVAMAGLVLSTQAFGSAFMRAVGDRAAGLKKNDRAIHCYQRAVTIDSENWRAYKGLGKLYGTERYYSLDMKEKRELAKQERSFYEKAFEYNPKDAELLMDLGKATIFLGEVDAGIERLKQATQMRRFNDIVWWNLGVAQRKAGRYEEALETFRYAATVKNSPSMRKNIQWLEKQLRGEVSAKNAEPSHPTPGVMHKSEEVSLDALHQLMDVH